MRGQRAIFPRRCDVEWRVRAVGCRALAQEGEAMKSILLKIQHANGEQEERRLSPGSYLIGRDVGDIRLNDPNVSGTHASLEISAHAVTIRDERSTNGIFDASGGRVMVATLAPGSFVRLGACRLTVAAEVTAGGTRVMAAFPEQTQQPAPRPVSSSPVARVDPIAAARPRGTIITVPGASPGILLSDGRQYQFVVAGAWNSSVAPALNQVVEFEWNEHSGVTGIWVVDATQIAKEHLKQLSGAAQKQAQVVAEIAKGKLGGGGGARLAKGVAALAGLAVLGFGGLRLFGSDSLSARNLKNAIDAKIDEQSQVCWKLDDMAAVQFPINLRSAEPADRNPIIQGLVASGYMTATPGKRNLFGSETLLALTPQGIEAKVWDAKQGFCVGKRRVDEVIDWTDPNTENGASHVTVKYTWRLQDLPSWVDRDKFSAVDGMTSPEKAMAIVEKRNTGWVAIW
jgi:hypothetical protein